MPVDHTEKGFEQAIENIAGNLDQRGMLECLRHGVSDRGVKLRLAYFQPANSMNPDALALYKKKNFNICPHEHFPVHPIHGVRAGCL